MDNLAKKEEFRIAVEPLMKFLNDHGNPHMSVIVTPTTSELVSGEMTHVTDEFVKD